MRFWIELQGVPIAVTELEPTDVAIGLLERFPAYDLVRPVFREGSDALLDLLFRARQSARGRRWRARLVARMQERARGLSLRTASGIRVHAPTVFLFDSDRGPGGAMVVVRFGESGALVAASVHADPLQADESARPAA